MKKYLAWVASLFLASVPCSWADTTVTNGTAGAFAVAVAQAVTNGGGTIVVTTPIVINATVSFDGGSNVVVSGGNTNSIFLVQGASLGLANFTFENGLGTNGGAIHVAADGTLVASNCIFLGNNARGVDGEAIDTNGFGGNTPSNGSRGAKGGSGSPGFGGAIFNLGALSVLNCSFFTNNATGGNGSDGGDGQDAVVRGGSGGPGGNGSDGRGGGIYNLGALVCVNSTFEGNLANGGNGGAGGAGGGGFIPGADAKGGAAGGAGGGGLYTTNTDVSILNCTFANNISRGGNGVGGGSSSGGNGLVGFPGGSGFGGGIDNDGSLAVTNSTFFENNAAGGPGGNGGAGARGGSGGNGGKAIGGGLYNAGTVSVVNCTFSKSAAIGGTNGSAGSGLAAGLAGKRGASSGGNVANVAKKKGAFFLMNSIVATGLSGGGGAGKIIDGGFNISADKSIAFLKKGTSKAKTNPLIGDLADNGGPTETIALATNSPAVDRIEPANAPATDQRGFVSRPQFVFANLSDIGAYELDPNLISIFTQPQSTNVIIGSNVTFSVAASGTGPLFYQWLFNGAALAGITNSSLVITNVQTNNAGNFQVVVSNVFNSVTSHVATLKVINITNSAPIIITEPQSQTVLAGTTATFSITATGSTPLFYQWVVQVSSTVFTNVPSGTNATLSITNAQVQANYGVTVTNNFGLTNSTLATLFVTNSSTGGGGPGLPLP